MPMRPRTNYLLFVDECGTHDMQHVDANFPIFVLVGLLVGEVYYAKSLVPRVKALKVSHFGKSDVVLHSRDIRRRQGDFEIFRTTPERKPPFDAAIGNLVLRARIRLFAVAIDKMRLRRHSLLPLNPYDVSLSQLLSAVLGPPRIVGPSRPMVSKIVAESRGRKEDKELQREFQELRRLGLDNYGALSVQSRRSGTVQHLFPSKIDFAMKSLAIAGLELADLAAYPIARAVMSNDWSGADAQVIGRKLKTLIRFP